jgi:hypothetical protein
MKDALRLLDYIVDKDAAGAKFLIVKGDKPAVEIKIF